MNVALVVLAAAAALAALAAAAIAALWIRERRRTRALRHALADERRRADAADQAGNAFFDLVSHEVRSPIASILGYQELLEDGAYGQLGDGAAEPVVRIGRSARHLLQMLDGVVDLARMRASSVEPAMEPLDAGDLLRDVAQGFRIQAGERHLRHTVHVHAEDTPFTSDGERLHRALCLLSVAAIRNPATDLELHADCREGTLTFRIRGARYPEDTRSEDFAVRHGVRLAVADATANLLGGSLEIRPHDGAAELLLRVPSASAADRNAQDPPASG